MKVANLDLKEIDNFLNFNKKIYPERKNVKKRFQYQLIDNPALEDKTYPRIFLSFNENNEIVGQFLLNPFEFHFSGKGYKGFLGCDYYVLENYRGAYGAILALRAIRSSKSYFAIGVTEIAKKIHLSLGTKIIGSLNKFIWFRNIFIPILIAKNLISKNNSLMEYNKDSRFPASLSSHGVEFKLIENLDGWNDYHWDNTLEFSRPLDFLRWRFWGNLENYYFYLTKEFKNPYYFVVRKSTWKGLLLLSIVDYKIPYQDKRAWQTILKASKLLAKMSNCNGVVTFSSHKFFDDLLQKDFFFKIGKPNLILTNANINFSTENINKRNLVFATMADSDIDFDFNESYSPHGL